MLIVVGRDSGMSERARRFLRTWRRRIVSYEPHVFGRNDAAVDQKVTTIFCTPVTRDPRCPDCGRQGRYRDAVTRPLKDPPVAGYPLVLRVTVPRYRVSPAIVDGWCSVKIWASWRPRGRRRPAMCSVCVAASPRRFCRRTRKR